MAAALAAVNSGSIMDPGTGLAYTSTAAYIWDYLQGTTTATPASYTLDYSAGSPLGDTLAAAGITL